VLDKSPPLDAFVVNPKPIVVRLAPSTGSDELKFRDIGLIIFAGTAGLIFMTITSSSPSKEFWLKSG
jgi:hypothetical protein